MLDAYAGSLASVTLGYYVLKRVTNFPTSHAAAAVLPIFAGSFALVLGVSGVPRLALRSGADVYRLCAVGGVADGGAVCSPNARGGGNTRCAGRRHVVADGAAWPAMAGARRGAELARALRRRRRRSARRHSRPLGAVPDQLRAGGRAGLSRHAGAREVVGPARHSPSLGEHADLARSASRLSRAEAGHRHARRAGRRWCCLGRCCCSSGAGEARFAGSRRCSRSSAFARAARNLRSTSSAP